MREEFIEKLGYVVQQEGIPRIAGRLLGLLMFDGEKLSFSQIAEKLDVSRGSVSTSTKLLEDLGMVERIGVAGDRQDYFRLTIDPYANMLRGRVERMSRTRAFVDDTIKQVPKGNKELVARLNDYRRYFLALEKGISDALKDLSEMKLDK